MHSAVGPAHGREDSKETKLLIGVVQLGRAVSPHGDKASLGKVAGLGVGVADRPDRALGVEEPSQAARGEAGFRVVGGPCRGRLPAGAKVARAKAAKARDHGVKAAKTHKRRPGADFWLHAA